MKQTRAAGRVKKSQGGFSVLLDRSRKAKRGGGGLQPSVWGTEIYVVVKLGYSLFYGALPVPLPPRLPCTHLTTLTFMLTEKYSASSLPVFPFSSPAILLFSTFPFSSPPPHLPFLTITWTQGVCRVRLSTLLTSTASRSHFSLHLFHLSPICMALLRRVVKYTIDFLQLRLSDIKSARLDPSQGFPPPIKLSGGPLKGTKVVVLPDHPKEKMKQNTCEDLFVKLAFYMSRFTSC